jgi:hypothetical protein
MTRARGRALLAVLAVAALGACSVLGGATGHEIDKRGRQHDDFWASVLFAVGFTFDTAIIDSEVKRRRAARDARELKRETDRIPSDPSCDPDRERKVCSALEGCRCESTPK